MFANFKKNLICLLFFPLYFPASLIFNMWPYITGQFLIQNVVPQESGECAKVKVKVRVNIHGVFSVSSASSVETVKTTEGEEPMETDQTVKEEEVCMFAVGWEKGWCVHVWEGNKRVRHSWLYFCVCLVFHL